MLNDADFLIRPCTSYIYIYIYIYICIVCHVIQAQASLQVTCNAATHSCLHTYVRRHTYNSLQLLPVDLYFYLLVLL